MEYVHFLGLSLSMMIGPAFSPHNFVRKVTERSWMFELNQDRLKTHAWNTKTDIKTRIAQRTHRRERLSGSTLKTH